VNFGDDLLAQARYLITHEKCRPKVTLRRAISTAYYALFHLLTEAAAKSLVSGTQNKALRQQMQRAFDHSAMRQCCRAFSGGSLPVILVPLLPGPVSMNLRAVASTFARLQDQRHDADYNVALTYSRDDADNAVRDVEQAFAAWHTVRATDEARVFLVSLLLWRQWNRT
jgi:uncharacterized protein (UPF0332 family)